MLKISSVSASEQSTTLQLEGSLSGLWVVELRRLTETALAERKMLTIDCCGVSFCDFQGQALMRELLARKVSLTNCSPFLQSQLEPGSVL
jgi:ABC-type transporter Mla MlaB component